VTRRGDHHDGTRAGRDRERARPGHGGREVGQDARRPGERPAPAGRADADPWEIEGPYYRLGTPQRSNLLEPGDKPELVLTGRVLNPEGRPIAGALVNFWHCDHRGGYDMVGYRYTGYVITDEAGRYRLTTIVP
jgi:hypothetical protein